jgi:hypothetical protein
MSKIYLQIWSVVFITDFAYQFKAVDQYTVFLYY